jgi:outer membrane protein OmpA-like peptidoglycan-associated protein
MKKFILTMIIALMMVFSANAQVATENAKLFDNTYVGVEVGATTPLNFNSMFPVNTVAGIKFGKELTPVFGLEAEGFAVFGDNVYRYGVNGSIPAEGAFNVHKNGSVNTFVKATNVGLNGVINWSNLLFGYQGTPRFFEVKTNTGLGWMHYFGTYTPAYPIGGYVTAGKQNVLTAKTAVDFAFNLGAKKAHTITVSPGIYWNLNEGGNVKFNKNYAQFGVMVGYTYHFKTSNGTHHFKTYDVGAMVGEIDRLNSELAKKPTEVEVIKYVDRTVNNYNGPVTNNVATKADKNTFIFFAFNSDVLTDNAKATLDEIPVGAYNIYGYASNEGSTKYNQKLSERRATAVAKYLESKGSRISTIKGCGVAFGNTTGRVVKVCPIKEMRK